VGQQGWGMRVGKEHVEGRVGEGGGGERRVAALSVGPLCGVCGRVLVARAGVQGGEVRRGTDPRQGGLLWGGSGNGVLEVMGGIAGARTDLEGQRWTSGRR